jgi:hypothetical protein
MSISPQLPVSTPERIFNTLPVGFSSWLAFYDSIPEWHRATEDIQFVQSTSKGEFLKAYGREPQSISDRFLVSYEMKRDFLLARCTDQLFAARLSEAELNEVETLFANDWLDIPTYLKRLFQAASSIAKKNTSL